MHQRVVGDDLVDGITGQANGSQNRGSHIFEKRDGTGQSRACGAFREKEGLGKLGGAVEMPARWWEVLDTSGTGEAKGKRNRGGKRGSSSVRQLERKKEARGIWETLEIRKFTQGLKPYITLLNIIHLNQSRLIYN